MTRSTAPAIVWFRDDLRLADNPALHAATLVKRPLICLYIYDDETRGPRPMGSAARWWLHGSLAALDGALKKHGGHLTILRGAAAAGVASLAVAAKAESVYWNRRYDEAGRALDATLASDLEQRGIVVETFNGHLLHEPWTLKNKAGAPFRVFSAYWRSACQQAAPAAPLAAPRKLSFQKRSRALESKAHTLASLKLEPTTPDWAGGLRTAWQVDEAAARAHLKSFLATRLNEYSTDRDRPDRNGTSQLSPYLCAGNISARQVWHVAHAATHSSTPSQPARINYRQLEKFLAEIGWREFNYHLLYHNPELARRNFQRRFDAMPWRTDKKRLTAWQRGLTGYPIVDAGMRQLWATGWMHNRVRMVTASFLVKHLLIDWRAGERWFWDTLVDADPANNAANWQWVAGTGADAAPYFRIFNPTLQGKKFDPNGEYVRRWVPELAQMPSAMIHEPWKAKPGQLATAGVRLGKTYPKPIVDHDFARRRALASLKSMAR